MAENHDKTLALLGIAATKKRLDLTCPPENVMSAFIENRVESTIRTMMLSHINGCEDCYRTWETLSAFMAQNQNIKVTNSQHNKKEDVGVLQRLMEWFNSGVSWQTAVPSIALASLAIAVVVNIPHRLYKTTQTDPTVVAATTLDADILTQSIDQLPVPWKDQTFGFNKSEYSSPVKAVGVGIWSARKALIDSNDPLPEQLVSSPAIDWKRSEYRDYFALGQWTLDAWVLSKATHVKPEQWVLLGQSLQTLQSAFEQRNQSEPEAVIALQTIDKMKAKLSRLSNKADLTEQYALSREIEIGLQKMFI